MTGERTSARSRVRGGLRRGAYLLPSLFTIGNMVLGFYAIVCGLDGQFLKAALLVFLAGFVDLLDGRIARMTGTESEFGREYDSLADVITFGATPGLLAYFWGLREFARDAWLLCVFYMVCAATRLARFNVQTRVVDSRFFVGLPMPAAAGAICSLLVFAPEYASDRDLRRVMQVVMGLALLLVGVLMVSTFRYKSFKKIDLRRRWSYRSFVPFAAILLVFVFIPRATFLAIAILYTLSAPLAAGIARLRHPHGHRPEEPPPPPPVAETP